MSYRIEVYVPYQLKSWWKDKASKNTRSLSSEIRHLLEQIKNEEENNKKKG